MDDEGRNEEEAPDNATTDDEDYHTDKEREKKGKDPAAARAASVDGTADFQPHDPDSELVDDTTEHNERPTPPRERRK